MKKTTIATIAAALLLTACSQQTFIINDDYGTMTDERSNDFFVYGIGQEKKLDASKICGSVDKIAKVESQTTFLNGLLGSLTFGIYAPREARVYCLK